jgi:hypothetical protein
MACRLDRGAIGCRERLRLHGGPRLRRLEARDRRKRQQANVLQQLGGADTARIRRAEAAALDVETRARAAATTTTNITMSPAVTIAPERGCARSSSASAAISSIHGSMIATVFSRPPGSRRK